MTTIILKNPISLEQQHQMNALFDAWTEEKMTIIKSQLLTWAAEQDMDTDFDNPLQGASLIAETASPNVREEIQRWTNWAENHLNIKLFTEWNLGRVKGTIFDLPIEAYNLEVTINYDEWWLLHKRDETFPKQNMNEIFEKLAFLPLHPIEFCENTKIMRRPHVFYDDKKKCSILWQSISLTFLTD